MIRNDVVQAALISYSKTLSEITAELGDPDDVREDQWTGTEFGYPNLRIRLIDNTPFGDDCGSNIQVSFQVFGEQTSSQSVDRIAGIINDVFHSKSFSHTFSLGGVEYTLAFTLRTNNLVPAIRQDDLTWRSEVIQTGIVS